jgi:uncharacterized repeat protein (TIGR03803 family)
MRNFAFAGPNRRRLHLHTPLPPLVMVALAGFFVVSLTAFYTSHRDSGEPPSPVLPHPVGAAPPTARTAEFSARAATTLHDGLTQPFARSVADWQVSVIHRFKGGSDGSVPWRGLIADEAGNLYGTTSQGGMRAGRKGAGTVFRLAPPAGPNGSWHETVLYIFIGGADGGSPHAGLIRVGNTFYGTTAVGGATRTRACPIGCGTIFRLDPPAPGQTQWNETVLWSFSGGRDGAVPAAGLIAIGGSLFGTTRQGGASDTGTVFRLSPPAAGQTQWTETVLWSFAAASNPSDGGPAGGPDAGLVADADGSLYGTTEQGGASGAGIVFKLTPPPAGRTQWSGTTLWSFSDGSDGGHPRAGLLKIGAALFGTTAGGGLSGGGTVFRLTPPLPGKTQWEETVLWSFSRAAEGGAPGFGLVKIGGAYYGVNPVGGARNPGCPIGCGMVFRLTPPGGTRTQNAPVEAGRSSAAAPAQPETAFFAASPDAAVIADDTGTLFGTTGQGIAPEAGTLFRLTPSARPDAPWTEATLWSFAQGNAADEAAASPSAKPPAPRLFGTNRDRVESPGGGVERG